MRRVRTTVCWAVAVLALAAAGPKVVLAADAMARSPVLGALAEEPLMLVRLGSLREAQDAVRQTRIGRHGRQEPLLAGAVEAWRGTARFGLSALSDLTDADMARLASREAVLVVGRPNGSAAPPAMLVIDLGGDARLVERAVCERVVPRAKALNPRLRVEIEQAASGTLLRWEESGRKKACMRFVGRLLAVGPEDVVSTLRPGEGGGVRGAELAPAGFAQGYLDVQAVWDVALARMGERKRREFEATGIPAVSALWTATAAADGAFRDTVVAQMDPGKGGLLPALAALKPGPTGAARVVPTSHKALLTCRIESGETLFELVEGMVRHNEGEPGVQRFRAGLDNVDRMFGITMEWELLPAIGEEAFVAVRLLRAEEWAAGGPPRRADLNPIWGFAVRDEQLLGELIERFGDSAGAQDLGWQVVTENRSGHQIHTIRNMVSPARFSLAVIDGYCVFARELDGLRAVLDAVTGGDVMGAEPAYVAATAGLPEDVNASLYVDVRSLRDGALALLERRAPEAKRPLLPLFSRLVPDVGGYAVTAVGDGDEVRVEGRGDLPVLYSLAALLSAGGAAEVQKRAARGQAAGALPR